jgi:hypothetical protein
MSTAKHPESDEAIVPEQYKGYPIVGVRGEFRGLDGGFNKGTSVQGVPTELDVFFAGKARQKGERYDYVVQGKNGDWRSYDPDDDEPEGVIYVRIYVSLFAMFADEELVGKAVHSVMEAAADVEALRKEGQQAFTISEDDDEAIQDHDEPGEHSEEHGMKGKVNEIFQPPNLTSVPDIRSGVPDDERASE